MMIKQLAQEFETKDFQFTRFQKLQIMVLEL